MRVTLRQVQICKIQQETQDSRQERAQEQGPPSGARNMAVRKKIRSWSTHLFILRQRAAPKTALRRATAQWLPQIALALGGRSSGRLRPLVKQ